jgi:hypothetical protein
MLELLVYCHAFASLRYPHHVAAVHGAVAGAMARCGQLLAGARRGRQTVTCSFDYWTERGLLCSLDRLDAYVSSMA